MCNDYEQHVAWASYREAMEALEWGMLAAQAERDLPQADDIRIRDIAPVIRAAGNGIELAPMRWGFPPGRPKASPVFSLRSEGRSFKDSRRCLIPASAFFGFSGTRSPKAKHRFTLKGEPFSASPGFGAMALTIRAPISPS